MNENNAKYCPKKAEKRITNNENGDFVELYAHDICTTTVSSLFRRTKSRALFCSIG